MTGRPESFDFVIVGAGAAGCVLAARLAENRSRSVLLLEAGPDVRSNLPAELRDGWSLPREPFDWGFRSEPNEHRGAVNAWRKKVVGGTSWLTRFVVRGSPADFDGWAAAGNTGWGWDDVLPYFVRLEADADFGNLPWHGDSGPMPVDRYLEVEPTEALEAASAALEAAGFPVVDDHNRPGAVGAGRMPFNTRDGVRVTTADAYLPFDATPSNVTIRPEAHVADVVFDGATATGVRLVDGTIIEAGWVVLSAGTYGSPPILMRSGVGPADQLKALGIPVVIDLAGVGSNLADHPTAFLDAPFPGPVRSAPLLHTIATFHSGSASAEGPPDLLLWISEPAGDPAEVGIEVVLMKPRCRGTVRLRSSDPREAPRIDLPLPSEPADIDRLLEGLDLARAVAGHPDVSRLCPELSTSDLGAGDQPFQWILENAYYSIPHVVGTCAMGPSPEAVVDPSGLVHGADRLSVVDASIIPEAPSGFPHVVVIMMAERISELLDQRM